MARILIAGLPAELEGWLKERLKGTAGVSLEVTHGGEETLAELARGDCQLLVLGHSLENPPASEVLWRSRSELGLGRMRVFYCVEKDSLGHLSSTLSNGLLAEDQMLLYPLDREKLVRESAAAVGARLAREGEQDSHLQGEVTEAAAGLWDEFKGRIFEQLNALEQAALALVEGKLQSELRQEAEREAHKLAGSLGTLGLAEGTRLARELEQRLKAGMPLGQAESLRICDAVVELRGVLERGPVTHASVSPSPAGIKTEDSRPILLVVQADTEFAGQLVVEAAHLGLRGEVSASLAAARSFISRQTPSVVLLDPALPEGCDQGLAFISELAASFPAAPILVLMDSDSFSDRLKVARLGAQAFLDKTQTAHQVVESVLQALSQAKVPAAKVLAVDDDPLILESLHLLLESRGMKVTTLVDPLRFWDALEGTSPDLLLLDVEMPHLSGVELCRVLRNDPRWSGIPVLFLTAHTDSQTIVRVFAAGADDYVSKPIVGPELVARISTRIARTHTLLGMAESSALGARTVSHRSVLVLDQLLRMARRHRQPLCIVVLQLDEFERIREMHGQNTADKVYRRVGQLVFSAFRSEDVVTRWEGDEFVVGMYAAARADGIQRLAELLEALRQEQFTGNSGAALRVSFSAGVAEYPTDGADLRSLYRAGAEARDQARAAGGDRVLPAGWHPLAGEASSRPDVVLVDDDETLASLLLHALETRGYRVEWFKDGQAALEALDGTKPLSQPRVLLLDVDLPSLDGLTILRRLAESGCAQRTRIIMLTARSSEAETLKALESGAFDHVAKPFSLQVLMQRVRRALEA
jgi:diguanylate cyclase (GGDEF)-like protein